MILRLYYLILIAVLFTHCKPEEDKLIPDFTGKPVMPASIKQEHELLLGQMDEIAADTTNKAAAKLKELLQHHFEEEENYVLPTLGLLPMLANGKVPDESKAILEMTGKFRKQYTHIGAEHQLIKAYLEEMKKNSDKNNTDKIVQFETRLLAHAATEEEILFPTTILIGEFLELKTGAK
jgi:hypothetical protein